MEKTSAEPATPPKPAAPPEPLPTVPVPDFPRTRATIEDLKQGLDATEGALRTRVVSDAELDRLREQASSVQAKSGDLVSALTPRLKAAQERAVELAPDDKALAEQSEPVKMERAKILAEIAARQGAIQEARLLSVRAQQLIERISDRRRAAFADLLLYRTDSIIDPGLWLRVLTKLPSMMDRGAKIVLEWARLLRAEPLRSGLAIVATLIVAIFFYLSPWRNWQMQWASRPSELISPTPLVKASSAAVILLTGVLLPAVLLAVLYQAFVSLNLLPAELRSLARATIGGILLVALIVSVSTAVLAPGLRSWRLVNVTDAVAVAIVRVGSIVGLLAATRMIIDAVIEAVDPYSEAVSLNHGLFSVATALIIMGALKAISGSSSHEEHLEIEPRSPWHVLVPITWVAAFAAVVTPIGGFVALGYFISNEMIIIALVILAYFLLARIADASASGIANPHNRVGRVLLQTIGFNQTNIRQLSVVINALLRIAIFVAAGFAILVTWGINFSDALTSLSVSFYGTLGNLGVSISDIVGSIFVLIAGLLATKALQRWLTGQFLPETRLDLSLQSSIRTGVGYLGAIVSVLIALSYLGVGLQNIAIVAGALSVGIGFGLQSIVNNFVSGLILLVERPIKIGDRIEVGARLGVVKRINVRATEIVTYDNVSVIVPNADLITGQVVNWMHDTFTARLSVNIGASYDSDPEQIIGILINIAAANERVLKDPAPFAILGNFGADALEFTLFFHVGNIGADAGAANEIRLEIYRQFRNAKIEIPFPQRDIHVRNMGSLRKALQDLERNK